MPVVFLVLTRSAVDHPFVDWTIYQFGNPDEAFNTGPGAALNGPGFSYRFRIAWIHKCNTVNNSS